MSLRQRQSVFVFALCSALIVACGSDNASSGAHPGSAGSANENAGASGGDDVSGSGAAGTANSNGGGKAMAGAPSHGGSGSGKKPGIVKLSLKVK